jgi:hypothetical protein
MIATRRNPCAATEGALLVPVRNVACSGRRAPRRGENPGMSDVVPHSIEDLERALLRNSVLRLEAGRDRCRDCRRSPLIGERMFVYASGRAVCELCRTLRPEEPAEVHLVRATGAGHTVLRVSRAA